MRPYPDTACDVQTPEYDPSLLKTYLRELGVPYFYESHGIIEQAACSLQALDDIVLNY